MAGRIIDTSSTEPATRGLRFLFFAALLLVAGACASTPDPQPEDLKPLVDRSEQSVYELGEVEEKLYQAETLEFDGKRGLAVLVLGTAQEMLPETSARERAYIDVLKATMWARPGEDRDAQKALKLLEAVKGDPQWTGDARLLSDVQFAYVVLHLGDDDVVEAGHSADRALSELRKIDAWSHYVQQTQRLSRLFMDAGDLNRALDYARRGQGIAERLDDDEVLLQACLVSGEIELAGSQTAGARAKGEQYLLQAYESAHRLPGEGWRNVVIATAVDLYFALDDWESVIRWGNRMRGRDAGKMPSLKNSRLWADAYLAFLAQYLHALQESGETGQRCRDTAQTALLVLEELPEEERAGWSELEEKLRGDLLQPDGDK